MSKYLKILKYLFTFITIPVSIGYGIYTIFKAPLDIYEYMILSLLILISTTFAFDLAEEKQALKHFDDVTNQLKNSLPNSEIYSFPYVDESTLFGTHILREKIVEVEMVALDVSLRTKVKEKRGKITNLVDKFVENPDVKFRYIIRLTKDNFIRNINRIDKYNDKNNFFAYVPLQPDVPFASFVLVNRSIVLTRSPYKEGATAEYLVIKNEKISNYFSRWFDMLWDTTMPLENKRDIESAFDIIKTVLQEQEMKNISEIISNMKEKES